MIDGIYDAFIEEWQDLNEPAEQWLEYWEGKGAKRELVETCC